MTLSFDLVSEAWIPSLMRNGEASELGIRDVLAQAPDIRSILDPSPVVTVCLHRLLLAILHRNFGPKSHEAWAEIWRKRGWDHEVLESYFTNHRDRFDLFHPTHPFFQVPQLEPKPDDKSPGYELSSLAKHYLSAGSSATLFDHTVDTRPFSPAQAARLLLALQSFFLGGTVSRLKGEGPSAEGGPLSKGVAVLVEGENLFETLMLNLLIYDPASGRPFVLQQAADRPAWEQEPDREAAGRHPLGYLDYLSWPSLRVRLMPELEEGRLVVHRMIAAAGTRLSKDGLREPQFAYNINRKKNPGPKDEPWLPVRLRPDKALWRDSTALLVATPQRTDAPSFKPPEACHLVAQLIERGVLDVSARYRLAIFGLCNDRAKPAKVNFWRHESMPAPAALFVDPEAASLLEEAVSLAERVGNALNLAILPEAGPGRGRATGAEKTRELPPSVLAACLAAYWSLLDGPFLGFLGELSESRYEALRSWALCLRSYARKAMDMAVERLGSSATALKQGTKARGRLEGQLARLVGDYEEGGHDND